MLGKVVQSRPAIYKRGMPTRIVTARPPRRRPEPTSPKPAIASCIVHHPRRRGPVNKPDAELDPEDDARVKAFFARMIRPPGADR